MQMQLSKYKEQMNKTMVLALPMIIGQASHILVQYTDTVMVGHLGAVPLAATGFSTSIFAVFFLFAYGFSSILAAKVSKVIGERTPQLVAHELSEALSVNLIVLIILMALMSVVWFFLDIFGQDPAVVKAADAYFMYLILSLFPLGIIMLYSRLCEGLSLPKAAATVAWVGVFLNFILNGVFIYGFGGIPAMGVSGAGLATFTTRVVLCLMMIYYVHFYQKHFLILWQPLKLSIKRIKNQMALALPSSLISLNEVSAFAFGSIMVGWFGAKALSAHVIALNIVSSIFILVLGFSFASTVRVGEAYGQRDFKTIRLIGESSSMMVVGAMSFTGLFLMIFKSELPKIFTFDAELIAYAGQFLLLGSLFQIFDGMQCLGISLNKGLLDVKISFYISFVAYWVLSLPAGYFLSTTFNFGPVGIWYGYLLGLGVASIFLFIRFYQLLKIKSKASAE